MDGLSQCYMTVQLLQQVLAHTRTTPRTIGPFGGRLGAATTLSTTATTSSSNNNTRVCAIMIYYLTTTTTTTMATTTTKHVKRIK
jgi:hypothetical protein